MPVIPCPAAALGIRRGPSVSGATGEHAVTIAVISASSIPCSVTGYPTVAFLDSAGHLMPFSYVLGTGQYISHQPPSPVTLGGGREALFTVAKYRCDEHVTDTATGMNVLLPGQGTTYSAPTSWLTSRMDQCSGPVTPDPGNTVEISAFEPAGDIPAH
ncbi:MAG: DUF4232 domain-containing protein [Actinomycetota bacterium]|nr:DUF4232 domain-containing protein [Actinomycetota bacterium]